MGDIFEHLPGSTDLPPLLISSGSSNSKDYTTWTDEMKLKFALCVDQNQGHLKTDILKGTKWSNIFLDVKKIKILADIKISKPDGLKSAFYRFQADELKDLSNSSVNLSGKPEYKTPYRLLMERMAEEEKRDGEKKGDKVFEKFKVEK